MKTQNDKKQLPKKNKNLQLPLQTQLDRLRKAHDERLKHLSENNQLDLIEEENKLLPLWGSSKRGIPNELVRTSLFNARNRNIKRTYYKNQPLFTASSDIKVSMTGEELRQDDQDVWLQIYHLARKLSNGKEYIEISPYALLKALDWATGKSEYVRLKSHLVRMQASAVVMDSNRVNKQFPEHKDRGLTFSLIRKFQYEDDPNNEERSIWKIWIEPEMKKLFGDVHYTKIDWDQRKQLTELAKWLHSFYASHAKPHALKVVTIMSACGSACKTVHHFKETLESALDQLVKIQFLKKWEITDGLVFVVRTNKVAELPEN